VGYILLVVIGTKRLFLTVSDSFNGECDEMVDMTLNDAKRSFHFGTNRFLIQLPIGCQY